MKYKYAKLITNRDVVLFTETSTKDFKVLGYLNFIPDTHDTYDIELYNSIVKSKKTDFKKDEK